MRSEFMKTTEKIIFIVVLTILFIVAVFMTTVLVYFCIKMLDADSSALSGIIGAIGGIIGGSITLIGVQRTIHHQKRKDFIDSYPSKMVMGHKINKTLERLIIDINFITDFKRDGDYKSKIFQLSNEFIPLYLKSKKFKKLFKRSALINHEAYEVVAKIEYHLESFWILVEDIGAVDLDSKIRKEIVYPWISKLEIYQVELLNISMELEEKYNAFMA